MKHLTHWILALLAITAVAGLSGAWAIQDKSKNDPKIEKIKESKKPQAKNRALKQAEILKALPTFKVTLVEAIQLAEKEVGGKAVSAETEVTEGKALIQVNLFVGDKFTATKVDPITKKITLISKKPVGSGEEGEEEEEEGAEEGG
jgi:hypothetical protein